MLKILSKALLAIVGTTFGAFCLFLAIVSAIRFDGWIEIGRLAPPHYPGIEKFDLISFQTDPLRAFLELGGNLFVLLISLLGLVFVIQTFRRGMEWLSSLLYVLPLAGILIFLSTVANVLLGRMDWILPTSLLLGGGAFAVNWIDLRKKGLPMNARLRDVQTSS